MAGGGVPEALQRRDGGRQLLDGRGGVPEALQRRDRRGELGDGRGGVAEAAECGGGAGQGLEGRHGLTELVEIGLDTTEGVLQLDGDGHEHLEQRHQPGDRPQRLEHHGPQVRDDLRGLGEQPGQPAHHRRALEGHGERGARGGGDEQVGGVEQTRRRRATGAGALGTLGGGVTSARRDGHAGSPRELLGRAGSRGGYPAEAT